MVWVGEVWDYRTGVEELKKDVSKGGEFVSALLLAAGESKRMNGKLKQLLPLGKSAILEVMLDNLLNSDVDETILVLGFKAENITRHLNKKGYEIKIASNKEYKLGMSSSIKCGVQEIDDRCDSILITVADKPLISSDVINLLLEEYNTNNKGIVVPTYQGERGHPVVFDIKYKDELLNLTGDVGAKSIVDEHSDDVLDVDVLTSDILIDVDTYEDYKNITKFFEW